VVGAALAAAALAAAGLTAAAIASAVDGAVKMLGVSYHASRG